MLTRTRDQVVLTHTSSEQHVAAGSDLTDECELQIPRDAMHTFDAPHNKLEWLIRVVVDLPSQPDIQAEVSFTVAP
jgi:hypothetical protein